MADAPFKVGDLVAIKSGGPTMTVISCEAYRSGGGFSVAAVWFLGEKYHSENFSSGTLVPADVGE